LVNWSLVNRQLIDQLTNRLLDCPTKQNSRRTRSFFANTTARHYRSAIIGGVRFAKNSFPREPAPTKSIVNENQAFANCVTSEK
jgi:hypothetical protein